MIHDDYIKDIAGSLKEIAYQLKQINEDRSSSIYYQKMTSEYLHNIASALYEIKDKNNGD